MYFNCHDGMDVSNERSQGDEIEQRKGYVVLVVKVMEAFPSCPVGREG